MKVGQSGGTAVGMARNPPSKREVLMEKDANNGRVKGKLVNAEQLLEQLFEPQCKPSIRWLRAQTKARAIPHIRIGHLVFFEVEMVRAALAERNLVRGRRAPLSAEAIA